jgi:hypothetical protein
MFHEDNENIAQRCPIGVTPASFPGRVHWRPIRDGRSFCMRVTPESRPFTAANVIRGTNRPDTWTNLWQSDPEAGLPASLELQWRRPVTFNRVHLTFDTNMNRRVRLPLFRYPECVRDYTLECRTGIGWAALVEERDNYMRRRVHNFDPITTDCLRLTIHATNGITNARVYEVRVYNTRSA